MIYVYARAGKFLLNLNQRGYTLTFELIKTVKYIRETDAVKKFTENRWLLESWVAIIWMDCNLFMQWKLISVHFQHSGL